MDIQQQRVATPAQRIREAMSLRGLRQTDVVDKAQQYCDIYHIKFGKSSLSQYLTGKVVPDQSKLFILGMVLDCSEAWLMGYDVPMEKTKQAAAAAKAKADVIHWLEHEATKAEIVEVIGAATRILSK